MSTKPEKTSTGDPDLAAVVQNRLVEQLAESERQHRMLLNELPEVVLRLDREGHLLYVNDAWKTRFGFDLESSLGSSIHDFLHKDDWKKWDALVSCDHSAVSAEFDRVLRLVNNGGRIYLVDARTRRLNSGEIVGSLEDVTDRHQLETERLRAQKLESIGRLAGGLAHDFNNLLTVILGNVNLGQRRLSTQEIELKELDLAARACNQAAALTKQMLAFSKGGEPNRQPGDLGSLVRDGVELYLRGSNIQVEMEVEPNLRAVEMDSSQIHQVLNNLVINAIQAMPSGGLLQVKVQNCSFALPTDAGPVRGVSVSVRDDGVGIPKENLEHIFEPYFTTKETGNGLGLTSASSRSIVRPEWALYLDSRSEPPMPTMMQNSSIEMPSPRREVTFWSWMMTERCVRRSSRCSNHWGTLPGKHRMGKLVQLPISKQWRAGIPSTWSSSISPSPVGTMAFGRSTGCGKSILRCARSSRVDTAMPPWSPTTGAMASTASWRNH